MAPISAPPLRPPALQEAMKNSTVSWQKDLESLFESAKDRFPDVVWELLADENDKSKGGEEVWGHKAIVYARAPPTFQARYFSFRPAPVASPLPYSSSPTGTLPGQSALSLSLAVDYPASSRSPSPYRAGSPSPSTAPGTLLRLTTSINPILFSNELEYLYTGKGFGEAFEFLFDSSEQREEGNAEENRIDKLRKDLVFMWRSRLYSDVRISLTGAWSSGNHESTTAIFSSHRFILVSRSPYFHAQLLSFGVTQTPGTPLTLNLPSPPFTPASLHFTLGFIYTGTLNFSHRTFDLETAFHVMRSATYLSLQALYDEIQARIVQEMMHGLYHAFLEFSEYERITEGKWGTGGCKCRQCARRAPRVLEFAVSEDVKNPHLERGARRALVGIFGEGWCTSEFASIPQKTRDGLLKGLAKRTTPANIFPLLFAAQLAIKKLNSAIEAWADVTREMVLSARKTIDDVLCAQSEECFEQAEWVELLESGGARFEDGERVEWVMDSVRRGLAEKNAGILYQTVVNSILLRPHPTETGDALLSSTSQIRAQVEQTRMDILRWMRKRWVGVQQEGGFDTLDGWALKEISYEIEVPVDDLISPSPSEVLRGPLTKTGLRPSLGKNDGETDTVSMTSLRASVLNRNMAKQTVATASRQPITSSSASVRSVARSTASTISRANVTSPTRRIVAPPGPRPDSKLTPNTLTGMNRSAKSPTEETDAADISSAAPKLNVSTIAERRKVFQNVTPSTEDLGRPKSMAASVRSHASTIRKSNVGAGPSTLRPPSEVVRPVSSTTDASTSFKSANSELSPESAAASRTRKISGASTVSSHSPKSPATSENAVPSIGRPRRSSVVSNTSAVSSVTPSTRLRKPAATARTDPTKLSPTVKRPGSTMSIRSNISTTSATAKRKANTSPKVDSSKPSPSSGRPPSLASVRSNVSSASATAKNVAVRTAAAKSPAPSLPISSKRNGQSSSSTSATTTLKGKGKAITLPLEVEDKKESTPTTPQRDSVSTLRSVLNRKASNDTIKESTPPAAKEESSTSVQPFDLAQRGATLEIGIPCIISSKRTRFRAFARYIGEVEGELGPWVGVEVPVGESWAGDKLEGRQWNDGTWGGIRYFEIGAGSEWDDGDDRAARRRRVDLVNGLGQEKNLKREGEQLSIDRVKRFRSVSPAVSDVSTSESRGLFVRPQQVLYVVDAVGTDF